MYSRALVEYIHTYVIKYYIDKCFMWYQISSIYKEAMYTTIMILDQYFNDKTYIVLTLNRRVTILKYVYQAIFCYKSNIK